MAAASLMPSPTMATSRPCSVNHRYNPPCLTATNCPWLGSVRWPGPPLGWRRLHPRKRGECPGTSVSACPPSIGTVGRMVSPKIRVAAGLLSTLRKTREVSVSSDSSVTSPAGGPLPQANPRLPMRTILSSSRPCTPSGWTMISVAAAGVIT